MHRSAPGCCHVSAARQATWVPGRANKCPVHHKTAGDKAAVDSSGGRRPGVSTEWYDQSVHWLCRLSEARCVAETLPAEFDQAMNTNATQAISQVTRAVPDRRGASGTRRRMERDSVRPWSWWMARPTRSNRDWLPDPSGCRSRPAGSGQRVHRGWRAGTIGGELMEFSCGLTMGIRAVAVPLCCPKGCRRNVSMSMRFVARSAVHGQAFPVTFDDAELAARWSCELISVIDVEGWWSA